MPERCGDVSPVSNPLPTRAVVIDASIAIAISTREADREPLASAELLRLSNAGYLFYAPGAILAETLFVLCHKLQNGLLTPVEHTQAIVDFGTLLLKILPPPNGEASLATRAEAIRSGYSCRRSADGIYIALAEELTTTMTTLLLTFDQDMKSQVAQNAPPVTVLAL